MTTFLAQNQFISDSVGHSAPAPTESAVAPSFVRADAGAAAAPVLVSFVSVDLISEHANAAVASSDLQPRATAAPISVSDGDGFSALPSGECGPSVMLAYSPSESPPSMTNGGDQEASAPAPTKNPDADALGTDCIHEIFAGAAKIDDYRFDAEFDEHAFLYAIEAGEEIPLFIRSDGYLKRRMEWTTD